jgi:hypothetical protein
VYSKKDKLSNDEFDKKNTKIRITTFIDIDLLVPHAAARQPKR